MQLFLCIVLWGYWICRASSNKAHAKLPKHDANPAWLQFYTGINRYELYARHDPARLATMEDLAMQPIVSSGILCHIRVPRPLILAFFSLHPACLPCSSPLTLSISTLFLPLSLIPSLLNHPDKSLVGRGNELLSGMFCLSAKHQSGLC